jgi:ectoine hydroxylase-related dioxygenase (phytanoyl-CoA dioxygenase family)
MLGESYRLSPDFWAWHVAPNSTGRGWVFHRDAEIGRPFDASAHIREDGQPRLCTIWIPLTDATTHNSCIYVLPFPQDPAMQSFLRKQSLETIQQQAQLTNWTNIRALPAQAGSVLGWSAYIIHWGSQSTDWATHARVSLGIYYETADAPMVGRPFDPEGRRYINLHDRDFRISFEDRLRIIANIFAIYGDGPQIANEPNFSTAVNDFCQRWKHRQK